jgi:hypothetical protein
MHVRPPICVEKPLALEICHVPTGKTLITPDHQDQLAKQAVADNRAAIRSVRATAKAVAASPSANGVNALTSELQNANTIAAPDLNTTLDVPRVDPTVTKRRRLDKAAVPNVTAPISVPPGPPKKKCEGCIHGDLLAMKLMEPSHIKYYLRPSNFLALAVCAGDCGHTIGSVHHASPKANIYYCDEAIKGFSARDDHPEKADLECGLILCSTCRATREARYYAVANAEEGTPTNRRISRRSRR